MKSLFLDSSVIFTAVNSLTGGSAKLFTLRKVKLVTSLVVLTEVERNINSKLHSYHLARFHKLLSKIKIVKQYPDTKLINKAQKVIVKKDSVILAEAKLVKSSYLITLDKKHFLTPAVEKFLAPQKVLTPKDFFNNYM
ncbi:hypothetical protein COW99_01185 [Candidatus Roizmanbacteria bacterium CG22_combo_CG10-13_8_21_14_all_38_20]|uniref:PIN domain-containing protein n=1 Tax=Candidatus Roizmanbacteria bacterium CG22_combo_CG10-13_8_21_14_all_38_20 TaxID=1974862 RepID=A0A2H0BWD7_9BACT|nr:type II toxin-antitoxin system VapC family toxin [Candidatus Microgenomates bacterium]PIP61996.1 MAG: hypothetical protein COW99_01185 [Candidatus Roizmanbacteria bacterium CG22_combo_CG10-13_8_21_14_all_38_20]PJC31345.1 MAG: hypothetical protein CO050_03710 [Candidatus Roizmanbacteria bacterium CG_4_9_14_0_2_um_filter_38_17]